MFPSKTLISLVFVALSGAVDASPASRRGSKATLAFSTRFNGDGFGTLNIAEKDRARARAAQQADQFGQCDLSFSISNAMYTYAAQVGVGSPATNYTLLVDTGSSNTWLGSNKTYIPTSASYDTGNNVSIPFRNGTFHGEEWIDTVTLSPDLVIYQQSIGVTNKSKNFYGFDGVLGLGPVDLTQGTVSNTDTVPTVTDNLLSQGTISEEVLGVYFVPISEPDSTGELTFGGYDSSVITDSVDYVALTTTSPASRYWGIGLSLTYGGETILSSTNGIVDTGTSLILLSSDQFQAYQNKTGGILDPSTTLLSITADQYSNLESLWFHIGRKSYELTANGQIWPRSLNTAIGGSSSSIYLIVNDMGLVPGLESFGIEFMIGYTFLERYYSVYDTKNRRVGFASTAYTYATCN